MTTGPDHPLGFRKLYRYPSVRSQMTQRPIFECYDLDTDPDGHPWEVAYNPGFTLGDDGTLTVPDFGAS